MASENKLQDIIQTSLENLRSLIDANTIIGEPINTASGTTIIPVSKISMGYATGGLDYNGKTPSAKQNFGGGGGTGISITPVGFLTVKANGNVEMVGLTPAPTGTVEQIADLIERSPEIFEKLKSYFTKKKDQAEVLVEDESGDTIEINITKEN